MMFTKEFGLALVLSGLIGILLGMVLAFEAAESQRFIDEARAMDHLGDHLKP